MSSTETQDLYFTWTAIKMGLPFPIFAVNFFVFIPTKFELFVKHFPGGCGSFFQASEIIYALGLALTVHTCWVICTLDQSNPGILYLWLPDPGIQDMGGFPRISARKKLHLYFYYPLTSLTRWTWVWVNSRRWWWTGRPGVLRFWRHKESDTTEQLNWTELTVSSGSCFCWLYRASPSLASKHMINVIFCWPSGDINV